MGNDQRYCQECGYEFDAQAVGDIIGHRCRKVDPRPRTEGPPSPTHPGSTMATIKLPACNDDDGPDEFEDRVRYAVEEATDCRMTKRLPACLDFEGAWAYLDAVKLVLEEHGHSAGPSLTKLTDGLQDGDGNDLTGDHDPNVIGYWLARAGKPRPDHHNPEVGDGWDEATQEMSEEQREDAEKGR